jgi:archaellum component FlaC
VDAVSIESIQALEERIRITEDEVREIHHLTTEIDGLKTSLQSQRVKINKLKRELLGLTSFKSIGDEELQSLRERRRKLEDNSLNQGKDGGNKILEKLNLELRRVESRSKPIENDYYECEGKISATKQKTSAILDELKHLIIQRENLFNKILGLNPT